LKRDICAVTLVDIDPAGKLRAFGIHDDTVEVKYNAADSHD